MGLDLTTIVADLEAEYLNLAAIDTTKPQPDYTLSDARGGTKSFTWSQFLRYRSDRMTAILTQLQSLDAWEFIQRGI